MKLTTTAEQILSVKPFVFNGGPQFVGPVLWKLPKADTKAPLLHKRTEDGEKYSHRLVWADGTGCMVTTTMSQLPRSMIRLLYEAAREHCEDIEVMYHGGSSH